MNSIDTYFLPDLRMPSFRFILNRLIVSAAYVLTIAAANSTYAQDSLGITPTSPIEVEASSLELSGFTDLTQEQINTITEVIAPYPVESDQLAEIAANWRIVQNPSTRNQEVIDTSVRWLGTIAIGRQTESSVEWEALYEIQDNARLEYRDDGTGREPCRDQKSII